MSGAITPIAQRRPRIPEAGKIKIGDRGGRNGAPRAIDTFRFTSAHRHVLEALAELHGGTVEPWSGEKVAEGQFQVTTDASRVRVVLPPDPLGDHPRYELWSGEGCERRCDGVTASVTVKGADGPERDEVHCPCWADGVLLCKPVTRLSVVLPDVEFAGVWRFTTGSDIAADELPGMVDMISSLQQRGLPYADLSILKRRSTVGGRTRHFPVVGLSVPATMEEIVSGDMAVGHGGDRGLAPGPAVTTAPSSPSPSLSDGEGVVEARVVDQLNEQRSAIRAGIDSLSGPQRRALADWWTNRVGLGRTDDLDATELEVVADKLTSLVAGDADG